MDDIEALCTRVMVIGRGRILSDGTFDDLRSNVTRERRLIVDLERPEKIADPDAQIVSTHGNRVTLSFDPERITAADLIARITAHHAVRDLFVENTPIEEIISRLYKEQEQLHDPA
jgi:ABC-2 type transport system ATP-binding protein